MIARSKVATALALCLGLQKGLALSVGDAAAWSWGAPKAQAVDTTGAGTCHGLRPSQQNSRRATFFCFMVVTPTFRDVSLMTTNLRNGLLPGCDAHAIYSNVTIAQLTGHRKKTPANFGGKERAEAGQAALNWGEDPVIKGPMDSKYWPYKDEHGDAHLSGPVNGQLFTEFVWPAVMRQMREIGYDWVVQVDPDTVFLPKRLNYVMQHIPIPHEKMVMIGTHGADCSKSNGQLSIYSEKGIQLLSGKLGGCDWSQYEKLTNGHPSLAQQCFLKMGQIWTEPAVMGDNTGCCGKYCSWRVASHGFTDPVTFKQCLNAYEAEGPEPCNGQTAPSRCAL